MYIPIGIKSVYLFIDDEKGENERMKKMEGKHEGKGKKRKCKVMESKMFQRRRKGWKCKIWREEKRYKVGEKRENADLKHKRFH